MEKEQAIDTSPAVYPTYGEVSNYEEVYLNDYQSVPEAIRGLGDYFTFYNHHRLHQALGYQTPAQVYGGP